MERDADGELPPIDVMRNRHEAWAWDEEKNMRFKGKQLAARRYTPSWAESMMDPILRRSYFGKDPMEVVRERYLTKKRIQEKLDKMKWFNAEKQKAEQDEKYGKPSWSSEDN
jgi:hypothetical protein